MPDSLPATTGSKLTTRTQVDVPLPVSVAINRNVFVGFGRASPRRDAEFMFQTLCGTLCRARVLEVVLIPEMDEVIAASDVRLERLDQEEAIRTRGMSGQPAGII